jgi:hypothetical protein
MTHVRSRFVAGLLAGLLATAVLGPGRPVAAPAAAGATISRVMLGWAADAATSRAVTWRTPLESPGARAQIAPDGPSPDLAKRAREVAATSVKVDADGTGTAWHHAARFDGLRPATRYAYRVGDGSRWSEWFSFLTAADRPAPFRFLYFGDAQNGIDDVFPRTVRAAFERAPDAALAVHAGDLLAEGYDDRLWEQWTGALAFLAPSIPSLVVPGNHDEHRPPDAAAPTKVFEVSPSWWAHFALPANGPADIGPVGRQFFYLDYQGVRFVAIDANPFANEDYVESERERVQASVIAWLRTVLAGNPNRWTIVIQHQPLYPVAKDRDYPAMRTLLGRLYDEFNVDLVLQGHDHVYARTWKLRGGRRVPDDEPGTVYVISVAGAKMYELTGRHQDLMARSVSGSQMFQVVGVDAAQLSLSAFSADGQLVDSCRIAKTSKPRTPR